MNIRIWVRELFDEWNYFIRKLRHWTVAKVAESVLMNLDIVNAVEGAKSSAVFERKHLINVESFKKRKQLFAHSLSLSPAEGLFLEFGTYKGNSINQLAKLGREKQFIGFDSFAGLPEGWTAGAHKGALSTKGKIPDVRRNVQLIHGFFEDSLPDFMDQHIGEKVAFVHIDCDLYSSTRTVLEALKTALVEGSVLVFDEFYNYSDWLEGEYKAWIEFCEMYDVEFQYVGYIRIGGQVAVQIKNSQL